MLLWLREAGLLLPASLLPGPWRQQERGSPALQSCLGHSSLSLHPNSRHLGKQQRKIPLLQQWNLGFVFLFYFIIFFLGTIGLLLSPPPCAAQPALKQK